MTYVYLLIVLKVLGMTRRVNRQHVFLNIFMGYNPSGVNLAASRYGPAMSKLSTTHLSKVGPLGLAAAIRRYDARKYGKGFINGSSIRYS